MTRPCRPLQPVGQLFVVLALTFSPFGTLWMRDPPDETLVAVWSLLFLIITHGVALAGNGIPAEAQKAIDAANGNWMPALEFGNVKSACQGFADDALFVSEDGKVTRGVISFEVALQIRFDAVLKITGGKVTSRSGARAKTARGRSPETLGSAPQRDEDKSRVYAWNLLAR